MRLFRTFLSSEAGIFSCVTSIAGPHGAAQLYVFRGGEWHPPAGATVG
jgi:hypothetical protein